MSGEKRASITQQSGTQSTHIHQNHMAHELQVGRLAVDEQLRVLAPPKQEESGGSVRAEGDAVKGPGKVRRVSNFI